MTTYPTALYSMGTQTLDLHQLIGWALVLAATFYCAIVLLAHALRPRAHVVAADAPRPPVTVLKPLHGLEPGLEDCLRSFFALDYTDYQLVFGVADAADPVLRLVNTLRAEFPQRDVSVVIDPTQHGINRKVGNLINMMRVARHDLLVLADADIAVQPDYLQQLLQDLLKDDVGVVTCLYRGRPSSGGVWARLGALFINDWFAPAVYVSHLFGSREFGFGATQAFRRSTLEAIGGFTAVANRLADDYWIAELARDRGLRTVLSPCVVETLVNEPSNAHLVAHELRWMRTIRSVQPLGYALMFPSFYAGTAALGAMLAGRAAMPLLMLLLVMRAVLYHAQHRDAQHADYRDFLLLPLRDIATVWVWLRGFGNGAIRWRDHMFSLRDEAATLRPADLES